MHFRLGCGHDKTMWFIDARICFHFNCVFSYGFRVAFFYSGHCCLPHIHDVGQIRANGAVFMLSQKTSWRNRFVFNRCVLYQMRPNRTSKLHAVQKETGWKLTIHVIHVWKNSPNLTTFVLKVHLHVVYGEKISREIPKRTRFLPSPDKPRLCHRLEKGNLWTIFQPFRGSRTYESILTYVDYRWL